MDKFIWISGSINSGKSTIAKLLSDKIKNGVNIEMDLLSHFNNKLTIEDKANFIIQDGLDLARNWLNRNFLPILNWPLWGEEAEFMLDYAARLELEPVIINLVPGIEILKKNRGERTLTEWELNRIDYMINTGINEPLFGIKIDNGYLTAIETLDRIIMILKNEYSLNI
jgi:hypothetical protein